MNLFFSALLFLRVICRVHILRHTGSPHRSRSETRRLCLFSTSRCRAPRAVAAMFTQLTARRSGGALARKRQLLTPHAGLRARACARWDVDNRARADLARSWLVERVCWSSRSHTEAVGAAKCLPRHGKSARTLSVTVATTTASPSLSPPPRPPRHRRRQGPLRLHCHCCRRPHRCRRPVRCRRRPFIAAAASAPRRGLRRRLLVALAVSPSSPFCRRRPAHIAATGWVCSGGEG